MNIFTKLLLFVFCLALAPIILFQFYIPNTVGNVFISKRLDELNSIASSMVIQLTTFFQDQEDEAFLNGGFFYLTDLHVPHHDNPAEEKADHAMIDDFMHSVRRLFELENIYIIDKSGNLVYEETERESLTSEQASERRSDIKHNFDVVCSVLDTYTSAGTSKYIDGQRVFYVGAPMYTRNGFFGALIYTISEDRVYQLLQNYPTIQETQESLVGRREGEYVVFMNPLKDAVVSPFGSKIKIGSDIAIPMQEAVQGIDGYGQSIDYKNVKIIGVWNYFPFLRWGIVSKIDLKEVKEPLVTIGKYVVGLTVGIVIIVVGLVILLARYFTRPIQKLKEAMGQMAKGNFRVKIDQKMTKSRDEIWALVSGFNAMVDQLEKSTTSVENLTKVIQEKEKAQEAKSEFISIVSHELRTPLYPMMDGIHLLKEEKLGKLTEDQKTMLDVVENNANRLHKMVTDVLDFQQLDIGSKRFQFHYGDLTEVISNLLEKYKPLIEKKGLQLEQNLSKTLPKTSLDRDKIEMVFKNIIENSIKFTDKGTISVSTEEKDGKMLIMIKDTGRGIPIEEYEKLFESFRRVQVTSDRKLSGTGLGLAIAKKIIEAHGGSIWFESEFGKGSTFFISLPIKN